jgi:L-lysine exporter family protein LysE/ArgO
LLPTVLAGFGLGLSLIVAIGAQNAFVLRQGLRGEHVLAVVLVCVVSDAALIVAGVAGLGAVLDRAESLVDVIRVVGALFLFGYGALAARRAFRAEALTAEPGGGPTGLLAAVGTCLALTWLNPHVYLDTVLLLGSVSNGYAQPWAFAAGAVTASGVWFFALGFGARYLRPFFARPIAWRVLDAGIAAIMFAIAISLLVPLF